MCGGWISFWTRENRLHCLFSMLVSIARPLAVISTLWTCLKPHTITNATVSSVHCGRVPNYTFYSLCWSPLRNPRCRQRTMDVSQTAHHNYTAHSLYWPPFQTLQSKMDVSQTTPYLHNTNLYKQYSVLTFDSSIWNRASV